MGGTETLNIVDLFCGVGGLSLGAARAGFAVRGAVDADPKAAQAHVRNFPNTAHIEADISELTGQSLSSSLELSGESLAGIIGGPPCQGFSAIGKGDKADLRNSLFVDFFRIVSEARPTFYLAENVPGIMREAFRETRERALSYVEAEYVSLPPVELSADDFGAATSRKRIFFFGYLPDEMETLTTSSFDAHSKSEKTYVKDALRGLPRNIDPIWQREDQSWQIANVHGTDDFSKRLHGHIPSGVGDPGALRRLEHFSLASGFLGTAHSQGVIQRYANTEQGKRDVVSKAQRLDLNGLCPTLRAGTGPDLGSFQAVRPIHPTEDRVITPREGARLQGFPDWFQFSPTKWHSFRQIGNSVSPLLAERLLKRVAKSLRREPNYDR